MRGPPPPGMMSGMDPRMMGPGGPNGPMDPRMMGPGGPNGPMDPRMMGPGGPNNPMGNPRMGDPRMMGKTALYMICNYNTGQIYAHWHCTVGQKIKKSPAKKLVKSNKSISRKNFLTKIHFLQFQKWPKINF